MRLKVEVTWWPYVEVGGLANEMPNASPIGQYGHNISYICVKTNVSAAQGLRRKPETRRVDRGLQCLALHFGSLTEFNPLKCI